MKFKFLIIMFCLIFSSGIVSAFEFDNVKNYDPITREITFKNSFFGIPTTEIGKARLNTPLNVKVGAGYQKVGEFDLWAYTDYSNALKLIKFKNMKNNKEEIRDYDYKYLSYEEVLVDDYILECSDVFNEINNSYSQECKRVLTGSHYKTKQIWNKITPADLKKNERLTIGIFTEVKMGDYVDWIPTIFGVKVSEWATWTLSLDVDLVIYYRLNETSGTAVIDATNTIADGFNNGSTVNVAGWIETAYDFEGSEGDYVDLNNGSVSGDPLDLTENFTLSLWIKPESYQNPNDYWIGKRSALGYQLAFRSTNAGELGLLTIGGALISSTAPLQLGEWQHVGVIRNAINTTFFFNGSEVSTHSSNAISHVATNMYLGNADFVDTDYDGVMDEVAIWNRVLSFEEMEYIYNSTTGYIDTYDFSPIITLNSPSSANYTTLQNITVNLTVYDDFNLTDVKIYVNSILNQTNASGINNSDYLFDLNLNDGNYTILGTATDNDSQQTNSSSIKIMIDTISPVFNITSPINMEITTTLPKNSSLNVTTTDIHLNSCWYFTSDNSTNITYTCNTVTNISFNSEGYKTIYIFANDTLGNKNSTSTTYLINYIQESATYDNTVIEAESHTIILNITASEITSINGTLIYNGTEYTPTITNDSTTALFTTTLTAPLIDANTLIYFNWTYNLNGIDYNSSGYNHTILLLTPLIISASCDDKALRFDIQDENNLSALMGTVDYNFKYGITNSSLKNIYGSLTNISTFYICINASASENYTIGYGEIQYRNTGYVDRRYYLFTGQIISNNTLTNHTLRDLLITDQTSFLLTMEDTSLNVYAEKYTALWRWYPDLDEYQIVEMGKTDEEGQTVSHINTEDVDYRIGLYETNGSLIKLGDPLRFLCTSAPCSFTLRVGAGDVDYSSIFDIQAEISYNETTKVFTLIYNDPNQYTSSMRFLVTRETGTDTLIICNDTSSGFTGVMACNTSAYTGLKKAIVYRSASPSIIILQKIVSETNTTFNSGFGLFISLFLWLAIVLSGFGNNPIWTIILAVVGLIPALIMGSINVAIFTGIAVLGAIIIHFIKRAVSR